MLLRQLLHLGGVAADEDRVGHQAAAVLQRHAALLADLDNGADEVLVLPHPPGHAMHDDADFSHSISLIAAQSGCARLAKPGQSSLFRAIFPSLIFRRTAPALFSYRSP